jgi:RHS repeat-associated protein
VIAGKRIIAQRKTTTGTNPTSSVTYLLADHLGSTVGTVSEAGVTEHMQYNPFGSVRAGHVSTDRGFTGQRREGGSRLGAYFYHARFYATGLGHFLSADTVSTDGLDRYAYVRFDPLRYVDPSGHDCGGGSPLDGILFNPCTGQPTAHPTPGCDDACGLAAVGQACSNNPSAWFCPSSNGGGGPDSDPDPWCHHDASCHAALECLANGSCAPPAPEATSPVAIPLCGTARGDCPTAPIGARSESGPSRKAAKINLRDRDCAGLAVDAFGVAADAYGNTLFAGNPSGVFGIIGGRAAFAVGLSIDMSQRDWKGVGLDVVGVLAGWVPGVPETIGPIQIAYSAGSCAQ